MTIAVLLAGICLCGEAPERANDFFWENDKAGFRAYGPGDPHCWSGIDVFNKMADAAATCAEVLHKNTKCGNWHVTPYKGILDNYTMGASRGCGGVAMYADGEWKTYPDWKECRVITNCDERCEFELVYPAFSAAGEMTCHITLKRGERFFKNTVSFKKKIRDFLVGPGLDCEPKRDHHGVVWEDAKRGVVALFEDAKNASEGSTATAIIMPGASKILTDNQNCRILAVNAQSFTYYAGAAWSKAGEIVSAEDWRAEIERFMAENIER